MKNNINEMEQSQNKEEVELFPMIFIQCDTCESYAIREKYRTRTEEGKLYGVECLECKHEWEIHEIMKSQD